MVVWGPGDPGSWDFMLLGGSWGFISACKPPEPDPLCWPFWGIPLALQLSFDLRSLRFEALFSSTLPTP